MNIAEKAKLTTGQTKTRVEEQWNKMTKIWRGPILSRVES